MTEDQKKKGEEGDEYEDEEGRAKCSSSCTA
jgi:hypothetical protein